MGLGCPRFRRQMATNVWGRSGPQSMPPRRRVATRHSIGPSHVEKNDDTFSFCGGAHGSAVNGQLICGSSRIPNAEEPEENVPPIVRAQDERVILAGRGSDINRDRTSESIERRLGISGKQAETISTQRNVKRPLLQEESLSPPTIRTRHCTKVEPRC